MKLPFLERKYCLLVREIKSFRKNSVSDEKKFSVKKICKKNSFSMKKKNFSMKKKVKEEYFNEKE